MSETSSQNRAAASDSDHFVRGTIDKLRLRLLDLTGRNPLISFKHAARTRRFVRVIDELPDQLCTKLAGESGMRFRSLGRETNEPDDEKTVLFRRALAAAKLEDPEYHQKLSELGDDPGDKAIERLEQELRQRLREHIGMPPRAAHTGVSAADVARQANLDPSYDLPVSPVNGATNPGHTDSAIQTLLFEDDMQATLGRMREVVRLSIEEAGVNPLFCVFGFLEWYEDTNSEVKLHAPLLLSPLNIERKLVRGQYQFMIQDTGEDVQTNVALAERLKRDFNLVLPPYDEGDTPESYFAKVQQVVDRQRGWKVRRWITVGLFSFARIAMYRDLAPDRWTAMGGLEKHAGLSRLIAGGNGDGVSSSKSFGANDEETAGEGELEISLIADADSSQLAALKDVLSGRNLVIEGPPGTGKSQTITNIIAATLAAGKTVLFLAEKMAALNVVRDRLVHAGLDDFCLQLHSTKAGRKETAFALARRLGRPNRTRADADLNAALARLNALRNGLSRSVEALGQPAGKLGITVQELLWRCHTIRTKSSSLPSEVDEIVLPGADALTGIDVDQIVNTIDRFERARSRIVGSYGSVAKHPWNGVANADIDPIRAEDIVRRVRRLSEVAEEAEQVFLKNHSVTGARLDALKHLRQLAKTNAIPPIQPAAADDIISRMSEPQLLAAMEHFAAELAECAKLKASITPAFAIDEAADACSVDDLCILTDAVTGAGVGAAKSGESAAWREKRQQQAVAWKAVAELMSAISHRAGWMTPRTPAIERALITAAELASETDTEIIAARTASTVAPGAVATLLQGIKLGDELRETRTSLSMRFELSAITDSAELRQHATAVRSAPILPFVSLAWWRARRTFFGLSKERTRTKRVEMARALDELANYFDANNAYLADEPLKKVVGSGFKGIDTDLKPLHRAADWAERVRQQLPAGEEVNAIIRRYLFDAAPELIESLASATKDPQITNLRKVLMVNQPRTNTVDAQSNMMATAAENAQRVVSAVNKLRLNPEFKLAACAELAKRIVRRTELRESLDSSESAKSVLGARFHGYATNPNLILASASHVRCVIDAGLPIQVRDWLLKAEAINRLGLLQPIADAATVVAGGIDLAVRELNKIVEVEYKKWLGTADPIEARAADLRDHANRCANDPEGLQAIIDDLRSERDARQIRMGSLVDLLESQRVPLTGLGPAAKRVVFQSIARELIAQYPALASFTGDRHESQRKEFRELDHRLKRLRQEAIASALDQRQIDPGSDMGPRKQWTGRSLIYNEVSKQRGHIPVRDLMERAGKAVQQLMPCFMMSPLSIAQFLKPGVLKFDLVVMDEASQLRPEDAVGAIARGGQIVVVGDPKQLPPTNFFREADGARDGDEDETVADEQSILDQALAIMRPARRLKWHYRSRHASLIAFSNKEFYDSELVVFPSPYHDHEDFGVKYVHVTEGAYRNRVNMPEAQRVAKAAIEYVARHADRSLGIVTLNQSQAEIVALEIDRLAMEHEEFEAWRQKREQSLEPFFVKNLENVQGDERDSIFISTVYGPEEPGKRDFPQRFGPINNPGGHRRLNVLFTHAKCQTTVFSSMDPADMRTDENSPWGVRALKGYLKFAKDGILDMSYETGRAPDSDFEVAVAEVLKSAGFEVVPQVGVVGYFIDLAVRHPQKPGEFALGIECDGATYHSSRSARDRDRLRQEVLERLKWRIHRIWSLDWYRNPRRETERLVKAVQGAVASMQP